MNQTKSQNEPAEEWRSINGYEGRYEVSNLGRVRSLDRQVKHPTGSLKNWRGRVLKLTNNPNGYPMICLGANVNMFLVHRLVAKAFIPNPDNKPHVNHLNGNRHDARQINLDWCTASENELHSYRVLGKQVIWAGLIAGWNKAIRELSKPVIRFSRQGEKLNEFSSASNAARWLVEHGVPTATQGRISTCCRGESARAYGYIWLYDESQLPVHLEMLSRLPIHIQCRDDRRFNVVA